MTRALIVVDVQNDFCEGGSLEVAGGADVAAGITKHIAESEYAHIVATRDYHISPLGHFSEEPDYLDTWPRHCVVGTPGVEFHPRLSTERFEAEFRKGQFTPAYSGFEGKTADGIGLAEWLRQQGVDSVDIAGLTTDYCVQLSSLDAIRAGFGVRVLLDKTAGISKATVDRALEEMAAAGCELIGEPVVRG